MKANGRFFKFTFILNLILGLIGFGIIALVSALSAKAILGFIICWVLFAAFALYVNLFIVKRAKLKTGYFAFGTVVNLIVFLTPSLLLLLL
ncbi:MAG: hypothetical protein IJY04_03965 [Clostridia bacterium]|nr:hypothetical protein [Clostridia bacterium]